MALHVLKQQENVNIVSLLTTVTEEYDRVSMHGVRKALLQMQADSLGLNLELVWIPRNSSQEEYEHRMKAALDKFAKQGVSTVAFGDIFLEDLKKYREENLAKNGMSAMFPIWKRNTGELARSFTDSRFKAIVTCVDTKCLDASFCGRTYDKSFLADLPAGVDPCGENGEFHTFSYDGPPFAKKIEFTKGEIVLRDNRFCFCDLIPVASERN